MAIITRRAGKALLARVPIFPFVFINPPSLLQPAKAGCRIQVGRG
jgi:hypothetical protein